MKAIRLPDYAARAAAKGTLRLVIVPVKEQPHAVATIGKDGAK